MLAPPSAAPLAGGDLNENSVVLRVDGQHGSLPLSGDVEAEGQQRLLRHPARLDVDVLAVPHHGAASTIQKLIERAAPRVALISVGADNEYGHPHPEVLAALAGADLLLTDLHGTVTVTVGPRDTRIGR